MFTFELNFLLSVILACLGLVFFKNKMPRQLFKAGFVVIPLISFIIFCKENLGLIESNVVFLIAYFGAAWVFVCYTRLPKLIIRMQDTCEVRKFFTAIYFVVQFILFLCLLTIPWAGEMFQLNNTDAVLFTLFAPIDGSGEFVIKSFVDYVLTNGAFFFLLIIVLQLVFATFLYRKRLFSVKLNVISRYVVQFLFGSVCCFLILVPSVLHSQSFVALFEESIDSEFYKRNYVMPSTIDVQVQPRNKNLIVLFLESMSNNFRSYTPELNEWSKQGANFEPGAESVAGTSWTIAGITAALCGIPLNLPMNINEYHGRLPTYLPGADCITDLLKKNSYNQIYIQGSSGKFTQKDLFLESHGNVKLFDDSLIKEMENIPKEYKVFWGVEDKKVFDFAKKQLDSLSKLSDPFATFILTVNTHQPNGYVDDACMKTEKNGMQNALRCSSFQIDELLRWITNQSWYNNTVVMVAGDHTLQLVAEKVGLPLDEHLYTMSFFLNVPQEGVELSRHYSNLDLAPSILEAMGWQLPSHGFGLGRSLFSKEQTMLEIYGLDSLNFLLRQRSIQYDKFMSAK